MGATVLKDLTLTEIDVDDGCWGSLATVPKLQRLEITASKKLTGKGISKLKACTHLTDLSVTNTLSLGNTAFGDKMVPELVQIKRLESLSLAFTAITDKSVAQLGSLPRLTYLSLTGTKLTADGVRRLRRLLPKAEILAEILAND
jgi:hypothetical protein